MSISRSFLLAPSVLVILVLATLLDPAINLHAQEIDRGWVSHTPFRSVRALSSGDDSIWAATEGGVFSYNVSSGEISRFTTTQGLSGINSTAIVASSDKSQVWVGYDNGVIDLINQTDNSVESFFDLSRAQQFSSRAIRKMGIEGDSLFVSTDFGLVIFDTVAKEVRDSYIQFGDLDAGIPVNDYLLFEQGGSQSIVIATGDGIAIADMESSNLKEPGAWLVEPGPVNTTAQILARDGDEILIGTDGDLYRRDLSGVWTAANVTDRGVNDIIVGDDTLFPNQTPYWLVTERFTTVAFFLDGSAPRGVLAQNLSGDAPVDYNNPIDLIRGPDGDLWLGDGTEGLAKTGSVNGNSLSLTQVIIPEGPFIGLFTDMVFDDDGTLWAAGTSSRPGNGFHSFNGSSWASYTLRNTPALAGRAGFDHVHVDETGTVWAGSAGFGLAKLDENGVTVFDDSNSTLQVAPSTTDFVRVRGIASEPGTGLWVLNRFSTRPINLLDADGNWNGLAALSGSGLSSQTEYDKIFVDSYGQKWIKPLLADGIIIWDSGADPLASSDDQLVYHRLQGSSGTGLPNKRVRAWAEDLNGRVWIGTERGIAFYFSPSSVFNAGASESQIIWPINQAGDAFLLRDVFVNDMTVDPSNQLWIASQDGAWLINETGDEVILHINSDNSPLLSDNVLAVAVDGKTGDVFFASDKGVQSWRGNSIDPVTESGDLFAYPNPLNITDEGDDYSVTVEGLVDDSTVKIVTSDGSPVKSMQTRGGRMVWDARDERGNLVPSGVYLFVASGGDGEGVSVGKLAVIR